MLRKIIIAILKVLNVIIDYLVETWKNKLVALALAMIIVFVSAYMKDLTPLVFIPMFVIPLFCVTKNVVYF